MILTGGLDVGHLRVRRWWQTSLSEDITVPNVEKTS